MRMIARHRASSVEESGSTFAIGSGSNLLIEAIVGRTRR